MVALGLAVAGCTLAVEDRLVDPVVRPVEVITDARAPDAARADAARSDAARPDAGPPRDAGRPDAAVVDAAPADAANSDPWAGWTERRCATDSDCRALQVCVEERCVAPADAACARTCAAVIPCLSDCNAVATERDRAFQTGRCEAACENLSPDPEGEVDCASLPDEITAFFCGSGMICTRACGEGAEADLLACADLPGNRCDLTCVTAPLPFWRCVGAASVGMSLCEALGACAEGP